MLAKQALVILEMPDCNGRRAIHLFLALWSSVDAAMGSGVQVNTNRRLEVALDVLRCAVGDIVKQTEQAMQDKRLLHLTTTPPSNVESIHIIAAPGPTQCCNNTSEVHAGITCLSLLGTCRQLLLCSPKAVA